MFSFQRPNSYWTLKCWNEHYSCMRLIDVGGSVKHYPTIQCKFLLFLKLRVLVFGKASSIQFYEFFLAVFWYRLLIGWPIRECKRNWLVLIDFQKINKNTWGRLELLTTCSYTFVLYVWGTVKSVGRLTGCTGLSNSADHLCNKCHFEFTIRQGSRDKSKHGDIHYKILLTIFTFNIFIYNVVRE